MFKKKVSEPKIRELEDAFVINSEDLVPIEENTKTILETWIGNAQKTAQEYRDYRDKLTERMAALTEELRQVNRVIEGAEAMELALNAPEDTLPEKRARRSQFAVSAEPES